jgi:hypothetical protein
MHERGSCLFVTVVQGSLPMRTEDPACQMTQWNRVYERPGRGHLQCFQTLVCQAGKNPQHVQVRVLALRRAHAERGIALQQFEVVESFLNGVLDVFELNVLVEIELVLPFRVGKNRIGVTARWAATCRTARGVS